MTHIKSEAKPEYYVIIKNDTSILLDGHGFIHTWMEIHGPKGAIKYVSFGADVKDAFADKPGHFDGEEKVKDRPCSQQKLIPLTEEGYELIIAKIKELEDSKPRYDMGPDDGEYGNGLGDEDNNCITICDIVLQAGGINYLKGIQTPYGLRAKIWAEQLGLPGAIVDIAANFSIVETVFDIKDGIDHVFDQAFSWIKDIFVPHEGRSLTEAIASADVDDGASHLYASPEHGWWNLPGALAYPHGAYFGGNGQDLSEIGRAHAELQSPGHLVCRLLLEKKKTHV